jgi:hypothetical protein
MLPFKYNCYFEMEAEQLNQIGNRLADLAERQQALRGYL